MLCVICLLFVASVGKPGSDSDDVGSADFGSGDFYVPGKNYTSKVVATKFKSPELLLRS